MRVGNSMFDPSELLLGLPHPSCRLTSSFPMPIFRRRPYFYVTMETPEGRTTADEGESQEKEEVFNNECPACMQRKEKKLVQKNKKNPAHEVKNQANLASTAKNQEKILPVQVDQKAEKDKFALRLNVQGFEPDNIQVKVKDGWLEVEAKSDEKNEDTGVHTIRRLHRKYVLPEHINPDHVTSFLSKDGYLSVEAPPQLEGASLQDNAQVAGTAQTSSTDAEADKQPTTESTEVEQQNVSNGKCPSA